MKKIVLMLLTLAGLAGHAAADPTATPTFTVTPNLTATQATSNLRATQTAIAATATYIKTAFPSLTPTLTPTGTLTPSATYTPAPVQNKNAFRKRLYFQPQQLLQADGITALGATPLPGAASSWLVQSLSQTAAVLSTGAAEVRLGMTVPWDYKGDLRLFMLMQARSTSEVGVSITANVTGQNFNCTTLTAGTFSYTQPTGGLWYLNGTLANIIAQAYTSTNNRLWVGTASRVISRVEMPLNASAVTYSTSNPPGYIQPGSVLNFDIVRATAGVGDVYIYSIEVQYDNATGANP